MSEIKLTISSSTRLGKFMLKKFLKDETGGIGIEYALIATLIGLVIIGSVTSIGTHTADNLDTVSNEF